MRLPVRTTLLQNDIWGVLAIAEVRLPVRTTLLQNRGLERFNGYRCDYQSERHCSKTVRISTIARRMCDYQSERHCSKTACRNHRSVCRVRLPVRTTLLQNRNSMVWRAVVVRLPVRTTLLQNDNLKLLITTLVRLPVRTTLLQNSSCIRRTPRLCDYQSERHCSKTTIWFRRLQ